MVKLYHYSQADFKGYIDPGFFGASSYSGYSQRISQVKRSYFYIKRTGREWYFSGARYLYIAEISRGRLYDLNKDKLGLNKKRIKDIYTYIKRLGFNGLIGNNGLDIAVLFAPARIKSRITLKGRAI
jgi:hypothetical protein